MDEDDVVQGIVVMRKGENPGEVIDALKAKIEDINKNVLPKDVQIVPFYDREDLVNLAVRTVTHNLIEGILLVTFIVLIFMARRQIKAKSSASGMTTATTTVVRQSAMNISTMKVTSKIPSIRLCVTVRTARFTRSSRS